MSVTMDMIERYAMACVDQYADQHPPAAPSSEHLDANDKEVADARATLEAALISGTKATHRHKKRGGEYVLIGFGKMQAEDGGDQANRVNDSDYYPSVDMREVAIYRSVDDDSLWVRPREEFEDGRFEDLQHDKVV